MLKAISVLAATPRSFVQNYESWCTFLIISIILQLVDLLSFLNFFVLVFFRYFFKNIAIMQEVLLYI